MKEDDEGLRIAQEVEIAAHEKPLYDSDPEVRFQVLRAELSHLLHKSTRDDKDQTTIIRSIYIRCIRMARVCRNLLAEKEDQSESTSSAGC